MKLPPLLKGKSSEIRGTLLHKIAGRCIGYFLWILGSTWQYRFIFNDRSWLNKPCIFSFWHNRILIAPPAWLQCAPGIEMGFLTSASKDGTLVAQALTVFGGLQGARGSSHRRGVGALMRLHHMLEEGMSLSMTPDGPKGPIYRVKDGVLRLAKSCDVPIIPIAIHMENPWRIEKVWDKFCIPKPFSRIVVQFGEPLFVPADADDDDLSSYAEELEKRMSGGCPDFEPLDPQY